MTENREATFRSAFDPTSPEAQLYFLTQRVEAITKEKEDLEKYKRESDARIQKIEQLFANGVFGVDPGTLKWLAKCDEAKLKRVDAAISFMDNAQFMGKWSWIAASSITALSTGVYALVMWIRKV